MFKVLDRNQKEEWNKIIKSFSKWDIYYLFEYANSFSLHGDGEPYLIYYEDGNNRFCYPVMKKDISNYYMFENKLEKNKYYDLSTPYGYGGPLADGTFTKESQETYINEFKKYALENNIVSLFFRFHPLLNNQEVIKDVTDIQYVHDTIYMDLSSEEIINDNLDTKNRNMIRKAIKNNVSIVIKPIDDYKDFMVVYAETMEKLKATKYYKFSEEYFKYLIDMKENANIFYAMYDGKPIAGSIMLFNDQFMHYHLSGTIQEYRNLPATNLLLFEAAKWGCSKGINKFHLGGGLSQDDSLFGFKKQFNKHDRIPFYIGRNIFDQNGYNYLKEFRKQIEPEFDMNNTNLIQYRK